MKCELCKQNDAETAVSTVKDGVEDELYVCRECAEKERARRQKEQKKRLVALGVSQETADKLQPIEIRNLLKRPLRAKQALKGKGLA